MDAKLVVAKGKTAVKEIPLGDAKTIIGRRNDCGLRIPSPLVSRQHCELNCSGNRLLVRDLGSSNGTLVNGARVKQKELKSGDTLGVGPITFIVKLGAASPGDTARPGAAVVDVADFVVGEDDDAEVAEFVVGEEAAEEADFVVAEPVADEESDFVVAETTDDTAIGDVADFVASDEPPTEADMIADAADEAATVNMKAADLAGKKKSAPPPKADEETAVAEKEAAKKPGLFGRLFKKKDKKASAKEESKEEPAQPKAAKKSKAAPEPSPAPAAAAAAAKPAEDEDVDFFVSDDDASGEAKPVGEDELADFLMGLNEKDQ
jgi:pSer/pThr/pTyr-binding forkhead associated (FHA) protein